MHHFPELTLTILTILQAGPQQQQRGWGRDSQQQQDWVFRSGAQEDLAGRAAQDAAHIQQLEGALEEVGGWYASGVPLLV